MQTQLFRFSLTLHEEPEFDWWIQAIDDYLVTGAVSHRPEYPNMRDYLEETAGLTPFEIEVDCDQGAVVLTHTGTTRGHALAAATLVNKYLRSFGRSDVLIFSYASVPANPEHLGDYGGGVITVTAAMVGVTTTEDLVRDEAKAFEDRILEGQKAK